MLHNSLPYFIRFRQCVKEFNDSGYTADRSFFNAIKYASAFPVIFLSTAQRVLVERAKSSGEQVWFGEYTLFRLWSVPLDVYESVDPYTLQALVCFR